jgi:proline racemase/trans-L-3-hydroxyproline dehydratase
MIRFEHMITAVDSHTEGEPTRIITGGMPRVPGSTMQARVDYLRDHLDHLRTALVLEPRGHAAIIVAYLLPPLSSDADAAVVFGNDNGLLGMCGHGAIGVATVMVATGMVSAVEPVTEVLLDTPAGPVLCSVRVRGGRPMSVALQNVPSFVHRRDVVIPVEGIGEVVVDLAFGGNWFAFAHQDVVGVEVNRGNLDQLMSIAMAIRSSLDSQGIRGVQPLTGAEEVIDHVKIYRSLEGRPGPGTVDLTLCPGVAYDRSPCGTGTSAKLALLHAKGVLDVSESVEFESIIGTRFRARIVKETKVGDRPAVVPEIEGSAHITGIQQFTIDRDDPLRYGFR